MLLKFFVIGFGHIGKRHASIIESLPNAELLVKRGELRGKNEELRGKSEELRVKSEELRVKSEKTETLTFSLLPIHSISVVATPNYIHCQQAIAEMEAGNDVIIEKPMGLHAAECRLVIETATRLNRKVFCVMQNRYSPPSQWLKEIIGSGRLGKIYSVQVNCFWNRSKAYYAQSSWKGKLLEDGGTLFTQFSHFVDTLLWLFGDIEPTSAHFWNFNHPEIEFEDSGAFDFNILSGGNGSFHYSTSAYAQNLESSITILAEHGSIKVGGQYMDQVIACHIRDYEMPELSPTLPPNDYGHYKGSASNHEYVYRNIIDVLNGKAEIHCTAEEGLRVVETIELVYKFRDLSVLGK